MAKPRSSKLGTGALLTCALLIMLTGVALFELGSSSLDYPSLTRMLAASPAAGPAAAPRFGRMRIRADRRHCREYALDNETQKIVLSGVVVCDAGEYANGDQRSRAEIIRDAFRGQ